MSTSGSTVWIVTRREDYEGGNIIDVASSREKATAIAEKYVEDQRGTWARFDDVWTHACDSVSIESYTVDGP